MKKILTVNLPDDKKKAVHDICAAMGAEMTEMVIWIKESLRKPAAV